MGGGRTAQEELETRGPRAVGDTYSTGELDAREDKEDNNISITFNTIGRSLLKTVLQDVGHGENRYLQVTSGNVVLRDEGCLGIDNFIDTAVSVEGGLGRGESDDGAVSASTTELALPEESGGETDGIVEGETKRLMDLFTTFTTVEEVLLDVIEDGEQDTAGCVSSGPAVSTGGLLDESGCNRLF